MRSLLFTLTILIISGSASSGQTGDTLNITDSRGLKQGYWVGQYDNGKTRYEGYFIDDKPAGQIKRYYESGSISALMDYSSGNDTVKALFYHPNGFISSKGSYSVQSREGVWEFFSQYIKDYMVCRENYSGNKKNGLSIKYHWNGNIAEEIIYVTDRREGEWKQYYTDGVLALRAHYSDGKLNGDFEAFTPSGQPMIKGVYMKDVRTGEWSFFNNDGSFRSKIKYRNGVPENNLELMMEETNFLDQLEKRGGLIEDPATTGIKW